MIMISKLIEMTKRYNLSGFAKSLTQLIQLNPIQRMNQQQFNSEISEASVDFCTYESVPLGDFSLSHLKGENK